LKNNIFGFDLIMSFHLFLGRQFIRLGRLLQSMAIMVMKPDDLVHFSRDTYRSTASLHEWGSAAIVDSGLNVNEQSLLGDLGVKQGRLLLLGVGGGRDAISLAKRGFEVTGVDYVPEMAAAALENAKQRGVNITTFAHEITTLPRPTAPYDVIWFSISMYSVVPTRRRRVQMLTLLSAMLSPGGRVVCQFHYDPSRGPSRKSLLLRRAIAWLTLGNFSYEPGDTLWAGIEFAHLFRSREEFAEEIAAAGFEIAAFHIYADSPRGGAILHRTSPI